METLGAPKTRVTQRMIESINPMAQVEDLGGPVGADNVDSFLEGVDLVVDGIDFFSLDARRLLLAAGQRHGIPVLIAAPLGFSGTLHVFAPGGMSFDEYFDLHDGQDVYEQYVHFLMGLAPSALHSPYMDISKADPAKGRGPSSIIGTQLAACVAGAEAVRILLGRGPSQLAPCYLQFDAYRRKIRSKRLRGGNRNWLQRMKKLVVMRLMKRHGLDVAFRSLRPA